MAQTPNYGFYLTPEDDTATHVLDWVQNIVGPSAGSNTMRQDTILAGLEASKANKVVESAAQPEGLSVGDEWDRLL